MIRLDFQRAAGWLVLALALAVALYLLKEVSARMLAAVAVLYCAYRALQAVQRKYDLGELRRLHEAADVEGDTLFCPYCTEVYSAESPACPRCGRR